MPRSLIQRLILAFGVLVAIVAGIGIFAVRTSNDFVCSGTEQRAMSEFPHYGGAEADWHSNSKISGGCSTDFTVEASVAEVYNYYQEHLLQRGWVLQEGPANSSPLFLMADRDGIHADISFWYPPPLERYGPLDDPATRERMRVAQEMEQASCPICPKPGETRVSISGGER